MKINEVITQKIKEQATAGATSAGNIASVVSPHIAIGKDRFTKAYTGSPGRSGTSTQIAKDNTTQESQRHCQRRTCIERCQPVWWTLGQEIMEPLVLTDPIKCTNCGCDSHCGKTCTRKEQHYPTDGYMEYPIEVCKQCRCEACVA